MDIEIKDLKKVYGTQTVVDIKELTIHAGELIGLVGNNGAGKTTLMRLIVYGLSKEIIDERLSRYAPLMHDEILGTKKYIRDFSEGNRQKIGIIGAMLINPQILILDEPFNYLDPSSQINIAKTIHAFCKETGATVILSSHNLNFVSDISSRILLLEKGLLIKDLNNEEGCAMKELEAYFGA